MAQVITRCRLTGHYMFMGMDVDPKEFPRSPGPFARKPWRAPRLFVNGG
jgi:hypothetical protein